MPHLEQYIVETPVGEKFRIYAANAYDAGKQVMQKIGFRNSLVPSKCIVGTDKFSTPE